MNAKNEEYQHWDLLPCNGKSTAEVEKESQEKKKKKAAKKSAKTGEDANK